MPWAAGIALFFLTIAAMEGVAYAAHRWVMHGWGWFLHKSHHEPRTGAFELNDLYDVREFAARHPRVDFHAEVTH